MEWWSVVKADAECSNTPTLHPSRLPQLRMLFQHVLVAVLHMAGPLVEERRTAHVDRIVSVTVRILVVVLDPAVDPLLRCLVYVHLIHLANRRSARPSCLD